MNAFLAVSVVAALAAVVVAAPLDDAALLPEAQAAVSTVGDDQGELRERKSNYASLQASPCSYAGNHVHLGGYSGQQVHLGGVGAQQVHLGGYGGQQEHLGGYGGQQEHLGGYGAQQVHLGGYGAQQVHLGGYGGQQVHLGGYGGQQVHLGGYGGNLVHPSYSGSVAGYGQPLVYGAPHYRADGEQDAEGMAIEGSAQMSQLQRDPEFEGSMLAMGGTHQEQHASHGHASARSYEGYGASLGSYGSGLGGSAGAHAGGPAVGLFPHGQVSNCAVPLLFSCSPSLVSGQLVKQAYGKPSYGASAYSQSLYRASEEPAAEGAKELEHQNMSGPKAAESHQDKQQDVNSHQSSTASHL